jgi:RNA polymerase sigma factor (sigma-70 family)
MEWGNMTTSPIKTVFQHLRKAVLWREVEASTDGQLLQRFLERRDETAFEALVFRHGPMVLGVCQRVLGNADDAEDAFQAAFLILVRKAGSIARAELLGNWLYGVAYRTALEARVKRARRRSHEKQVKDMPHPAVGPEADRTELAALLDHELNRLPDKYRVPVVLCDLTGGTRKEVAQQLGLPEGTLSSRLATAHKLLAKRLARYGLVVSGGVLATTLAQTAAASVPAALVLSTVHAAAGTAAGKAMTTAVVSNRVVQLMEGVLKTMFIQKIKTLMMVLLAILIFGGGLLAYRTSLGTAAAQEEQTQSPVPMPGNKGGTPQEQDEAARKAREEAAARDANAREAAAREAAAKAAKANETPSYPTPAGKIMGFDFEEAAISIRPFQPFAAEQPSTIRILGVKGVAFCDYRVEERPALGTEPKWEAAYLGHKLDTQRVQRLQDLLKKTKWLTAPGYEGRATHLHPTKYTLTIQRQGKRRTIILDGDKGEPYKSLITFFRGIAHQENLLYRLERLPAREKYAACREIEQYILAEQGKPYGKPTVPIDLRRFEPTFERYVRNPFTYSREELVPALRLLGYLRSASEREYIAALANDRDFTVREAVAEALGALGGPESVAVLRRMVRSTPEAAWQLIRLGPVAVPAIVELIESGKNPFNEREPYFLDYQKVIRAYIDHWDKVPQPIDPRVLAAVRKSMAVPNIKTYGTQYHKKLLELAARPAPPPAPPAHAKLPRARDLRMDFREEFPSFFPAVSLRWCLFRGGRSRLNLPTGPLFSGEDACRSRLCRLLSA